jgi:hypothetical protein
LHPVDELHDVFALLMTEVETRRSYGFAFAYEMYPGYCEIGSWVRPS